ncbi:MAG: penicillin-binding protein activator [Rubricoccaceae bacterium]|nr:penicillin-binding protein activator [Rubricoccaceae bacterium]
MRVRLVLAVLTVLINAPALRAQPATAERVPAAETAFENGLRAYVEGAYAEAERLFLRAAEDFGYNARTTAALVMAGKAAYAEGAFDRAAARLGDFAQRYPGSRYVAEAERVRGLALQGGPDGPAVPPFDLGIVLPASGDAGYLAQALFNGVRLAVDEYNARGPRRPVRMVFRDTEGTDLGTRAAVDAAVQAGTDAIVGPLFSEEALAAAPAAEAAGVVLVAPLATDGAVSAGRRYVFQTNPTFAMRGRMMANAAAQRLGLDGAGTVAVRGSYGAEMADAFEGEWRRLGRTVVLSERLESDAAWRRLADRLPPERWFGVEGVYLPVSGNDAAENAADALRGLEALGLEGDVQALGNTEWEGLDASRPRASRFRTVFDQDFFVDEDAAAGFVARYRALAGVGVDRLALMGYDATRFLLGLLGAPGETTLAEEIRRAPGYQGLAHRFDFGGGQVNRAFFLMGYRDGEAVLLE